MWQIFWNKKCADEYINTVVLYGQKKRKKDNQVKLITTKKYDYQEIVDYIFEDKEIKNEDVKSDARVNRCGNKNNWIHKAKIFKWIKNFS